MKDEFDIAEDERADPKDTPILANCRRLSIAAATARLIASSLEWFKDGCKFFVGVELRLLLEDPIRAKFNDGTTTGW